MSRRIREAPAGDVCVPRQDGPRVDAASVRPDVAIVVVTWNSGSLVGGFLAALPAAAGQLAWTVVVVDNDSSDDTLRAVRGSPLPVRVLALSANVGYAAGLNAGIRSVDANCYLLCNPDVRFEPTSIERLIAALDRRAGIAVPRIRDGDGQLVHSLRREPSVVRALSEAILGGYRAGRIGGLGEVIRDESYYESPQWPTWASGAAMLVSRDCLEAVGPWDERFFLYSEETDFALRARDAGYEVRYEPAATAIHTGGDLHRSAQLWVLQATNRVRLYRKRHGRAATTVFWLAVCMNEAVRTVGRRAGLARPALRELLRQGPSLLS